MLLENDVTHSRFDKDTKILFWGFKKKKRIILQSQLYVLHLTLGF